MPNLAEQLAVLFPNVRAQYGRCIRKARYSTMPDAMDAAVKRHRSTGIELYTYPCPDGAHWHLSHVPPTTVQVAQLEAYAGKDPRRAEAELTRRARAVKACQRTIEAHRAQSRRQQMQPMDTPFPDRIRAHYTAMRQNLVTHVKLVDSYLTAVFEYNALVVLANSGEGFEAFCTSWSTHLEAQLNALAAEMAAEASSVAEAMNAQLAQLDRDEQAALVECRAAMSARYTARMTV